jgi:hypothetical protein
MCPLPSFLSRPFRHWTPPPTHTHFPPPAGGWLGNYGGEISDATCTDVQHSVPISTCLMFYKFTTFLRGGYHVQHLSERWAAALAAGCSPAGAAVQPPGRVP